MEAVVAERFLMWVLVALVVSVSAYVLAIYTAWAIVWRMQKTRGLKARVFRAIVVEWAAVAAILVLGAFTHLRRLARLATGKQGGVPVVCVHGYTQNFGNFYVLSRALSNAGCGPVYGLNLPGRFSGLDTGSAALAKAVDQVMKETGATQVDVVCHSMGGLVARRALHGHGLDGKVRRVVTLGTPHRGTILGMFGLGANSSQMRPGSAFISELPPPPPTLTSIWSTADAMMLPVTSPSLPGQEVTFEDMGHLTLLLSPRVAKAVAHALTSPDAAQHGTSPLDAANNAAGPA